MESDTRGESLSRATSMVASAPALNRVPLARRMSTAALSSETPCDDAERVCLEQIHHAIGQAFLTDLELLLKQPLRLEQTQLRWVSYAAFVKQALYPSHTASAHSATEHNHAAWHCPPTTAAYLLDALLGGGRYLPPPLTRPLTDIEQGLLGRLAGMLWKQVETQWSAITALQLETTHLDSDGPRLRIAAANETMLVVDWTLTSQHVRTSMQLIYPWAEIQRMVGHLPKHPSPTPAVDSPAPASLHSAPASLHSAPASLHRPSHAENVLVNLDWATTALPVADLANLAVGDLLITDGTPESLTRVSVAGGPVHSPVHLGRVVRQQGRLYLRVESSHPTEPVNRPTR